MKSTKAPKRTHTRKRGRPLTMADLMAHEARTPREHGGPFRNVRMQLDGTCHTDPRLRRILAEELSAFTATLVQKGQRRDQAGAKNLKRRNDALQDQADVKARNAFNRWCEDPRRSGALLGLSTAEKLRKYRKIGRPKDRNSRRLGALLKSGRL